ncbi:MAG TPA: hypothetical protein PLJ23_03120 [Gemmatimonadales bacterium]|jgi:hypothetical protein|nr:hypothetical protein [Gemmatimonadales bacterium]
MIAPPTTRPLHRDRRGAALIMALLVSIAISAMALGAILMTSSASETTRFTAREASLQAAANGGLELVRDSLNRGLFDSLLPLNGFTTIASNASVTDAGGTALPRMTRSLYVGRTGGRTGGSATAGQYGSNFASAVSVIRDQRGAVAARRLLMTQESWAKYAVAINNWAGSAAYGCSESITGPFHSNNALKLQSGCSTPKVTFTGPVSVVGSVTNQSSGDYRQGIKLGATAIPWPTPARINLMRQYAQDADASNGDYDLTAPTTGSHTPGMRIEFLTVDVNGNGTIEWNEGFMRVWVARNTSDSALAYTSGRRWPRVPSGTTYNNDPNMISWNCGAVVNLNGTQKFHTAQQIYTGVAGTAAVKRSAVQWVLSGGATGSRPAAITAAPAPAATRKCLLGGAPELFSTTGVSAITPDSATTNAASHPMGFWKKRRSGALGSLTAIRTDAAYLIPLGANVNFKGVIFVQGDVAVSGKLRGRVSIFATGNIILADDLLYQNAPGTKCDSEGDIMGAIATMDMLIADNSVQTPFEVNNTLYGGFDDSPADEQYNMFILAAGTGTGNSGNFYTTGLSGVPGPAAPYFLTGTKHASATAEVCANGPAGCIRISGGMAMGRVDYYTYSSSTSGSAYGYAEAHAYDPCGAVNPPPYFPTTGRFVESRYYELDPVWLNQKGIANYFADLRAQ